MRPGISLRLRGFKSIWTQTEPGRKRPGSIFLTRRVIHIECREGAEYNYEAPEKFPIARLYGLIPSAWKEDRRRVLNPLRAPSII